MDGAKAEEVEQERAAFLKICRAFQGYAADAAEEVHRWERMFERLPPAHQSLLAHHRDKHVEAYRCVGRNDKFLICSTPHSDFVFDEEGVECGDIVLADVDAERLIDMAGSRHPDGP